MNKAVTATIGVALAAGTVLVAPGAAADTTETLRAADVSINKVGDGSAEFFRDGLHLSATDGGGVGVETSVNTAFRDVATGLDYRYVGGHGYEPGVYVGLDLGHNTTDAPDGTVDARLTYEHEYEGAAGGDTGHLWLQARNGADLSDLKANAEAAGMSGGGHGSNWHGTWEEWQDVVTADTQIATVGVSLGLPGDGVLKWMSLGDTEYRFTSDAAPLPTAKPVADASIKQVNRSARVHVTATQPDGTQATRKGAYYRVQKYNPHTNRVRTVAKGRVKADNGDRVRVRWPKARRDQVVRVISYGNVIGSQRISLRGPVSKPVVRAYIADWTNKRRMRARVLVTADQPSNTRPTRRGAFYRVVKYNPRNGNQWTVRKGRVQDGERDWHFVKFGKNRKRHMVVAVISYRDIKTREHLFPRR